MSIDTYDVKVAVDFHLREFTTIESVAKYLRVSRETLRKKFMQKEKVSLGEYINMCKVQAMKEYLILTDSPCYFVCYLYGFREDSGAKLFKRHTGMTMAAYRQANKYKNPFKKTDVGILSWTTAIISMLCSSASVYL